MQMNAEASLLDYATFIVASPLLMPKAWQEAGYFFCLATKEVPERKRPDYGSRWRTSRRSAKSSELAALKQQSFLNASLLLPFAVEPKVDHSFLRNDAVAKRGCILFAA